MHVTGELADCLIAGRVMGRGRTCHSIESRSWPPSASDPPLYSDGQNRRTTADIAGHRASSSIPEEDDTSDYQPAVREAMAGAEAERAVPVGTAGMEAKLAD
jgi:hypothetical protein